MQGSYLLIVLSPLLSSNVNVPRMLGKKEGGAFNHMCPPLSNGMTISSKTPRAIVMQDDTHAMSIK